MWGGELRGGGGMTCLEVGGMVVVCWRKSVRFCLNCKGVLVWFGRSADVSCRLGLETGACRLPIYSLTWDYLKEVEIYDDTE